MSSGMDCWGGMAVCARQQTWGEWRGKIGFLKKWTWEQSKRLQHRCVNKKHHQHLTRVHQEECWFLLANRILIHDVEILMPTVTGASAALMHACIMHVCCLLKNPIGCNGCVLHAMEIQLVSILMGKTCFCSLQDAERTRGVKSSGTSPCIKRASWCKICTWARHRDESSLGRSDRAAVCACVLPTTMLLSHWAAEHCLYWLGEILLDPPLTPILSTKTGPGAADGGWRFS